MAGVAGANIANAAGRPDSGGTPWSSEVIQAPIGAYVESPLENKLASSTNYIGFGTVTAQKTNTLGEGSIVAGTAPQPDFIVGDNDNDAIGGTSQYVRAAGTIAAGGTCSVTAGAATAGAGNYVCNVYGGVVVGDFFWATTSADS